MKCENCPAAWEDRSYEGECNDCGCRIMGHDMVGDDCSLSLKEVNKRLDQLEDYHNGKIERPQWVVNRFIRELDACNSMFGLDLGLPAYPPKKTNNSLYKSIYGRIDVTYSEYSAYRQGYEDAKKGLEENPYKHYDRQPEKIRVRPLETTSWETETYDQGGVPDEWWKCKKCGYSLGIPPIVRRWRYCPNCGREVE